MADSSRASNDLFARLRTAFTGAEVVEITFLIWSINRLNPFNNCLRVMHRGEYEPATRE